MIATVPQHFPQTAQRSLPKPSSKISTPPSHDETLPSKARPYCFGYGPGSGVQVHVLLVAGFVVARLGLG